MQIQTFKNRVDTVRKQNSENDYSSDQSDSVDDEIIMLNGKLPLGNNHTQVYSGILNSGFNRAFDTGRPMIDSEEEPEVVNVDLP